MVRSRELVRGRGGGDSRIQEKRSRRDAAGTRNPLDNPRKARGEEHTVTVAKGALVAGGHREQSERESEEESVAGTAEEVISHRPPSSTGSERLHDREPSFEVI